MKLEIRVYRRDLRPEPEEPLEPELRPLLPLLLLPPLLTEPPLEPLRPELDELPRDGAEGLDTRPDELRWLGLE
jgi:hypothetical protein